MQNHSKKDFVFVTLPFIIYSATFVSSHIHKYMHSMRFIAVLDDCNDSRRLAMTKCRKKGRERGCEGEERKKGRKEGRGGFKGEGREERKGNEG